MAEYRQNDHTTVSKIHAVRFNHCIFQKELSLDMRLSGDLDKIMRLSSEQVDLDNVMRHSDEQVDLDNVMRLSGEQVDLDNVMILSSEQVDLDNVMRLSGDHVDLDNVMRLSGYDRTWKIVNICVGVAAKRILTIHILKKDDRCLTIFGFIVLRRSK
ncbi:hypothetical protein CHS0354_004283, partial [Potamilus streckersoni]